MSSKLPYRSQAGATPTKRKRPHPNDEGYASTPTSKKPTIDGHAVASKDLKTPAKNDQLDGNADASASQANRSAQRKTAKWIQNQANSGDGDDLDELGNEDTLAQKIWAEDAEDESESSEAAEESHQVGEAGEDNNQAETPKRGRGRPKGSKKKRTPTPPPDLPGYEHYFFQNRPGGAQTSNNTLSSLSLLNHEEYFSTIQDVEDSHKNEIEFLHSLHSRSFDQWLFELQEGFNICVYGWGSKRELLINFAAHISAQSNGSKIIVVNGYNTSLHIRDVLALLASVIPSLQSNVSGSGNRLGSQPADAVNTILSALSNDPPASPHLLIIHSMDSQPLRRLGTQSLLGLLASSPHIHVVASVDTPNFPLMWDVQLRSRFNWLFHDVTTFQSFDVELSGKAGGVVDEVNILLGRSGRRVDGREGVMYVLRSLTENARNLFALLVAELLSLEDADDMNGQADRPEDDEFEDALAEGMGNPAAGNRSGRGILSAGIEFRILYQKATSQFIATNEHAFRGMLKEFYDHEMVIVRKDGVGAEVLSVPFRREELETILAELMGGD